MKRKRMIMIALLLLAATVAVMSAVFTFKKAVISVILSAVGIVFTAMPVLYIGKRMAADIRIIKNGKKRTGKCIKNIWGKHLQFWQMLVEWKDDKGNTKHRHFTALRLHFRCPYNVKVYTLGNDYYMSNLGMLTIIRELLHLLFFLLVWGVCSMGTIHLLTEILK